MRHAMWFLLLWLGMFSPLMAQTAQMQPEDAMEVMKPFVEEDDDREMFTDEEKHQILFYMGGLLLVLLILTVTFGVGMVLFEKPWFVGHMVSAGLTFTLALAHAVAATVWFFPF